MSELNFPPHCERTSKMGIASFTAATHEVTGYCSPRHERNGHYDIMQQPIDGQVLLVATDADG